MGIFGTSGDDNISIYSLDKDLRTISVRQWNFSKNTFWTPTAHEANAWLYTQVLTGDAVDGYKGCKGIGKVKAAKALGTCKNELELLEQSYVLYWNAYKKDQDVAKKMFLEQMGQARILHKTDYIALLNFDTTYDPFEIMNVTSELLNKWQDDYLERTAKDKKNGKRKETKVPKV